MNYFMLLWLFSATLSAQQVKIVKGHVCVLTEDSIERSLPYASVVVLEGKDSAFVKGMASDANGSFKVGVYTTKANGILVADILYRYVNYLSEVRSAYDGY